MCHYEGNFDNSLVLAKAPSSYGVGILDALFQDDVFACLTPSDNAAVHWQINVFGKSYLVTLYAQFISDN